MRTPTRVGLLLLVFAVIYTTSAFANVDRDRDADKDKDKDKKQSTQVTAAKTGSTGSCSLGSAKVNLNANNVRALLKNTGGLFWDGGPAEYEVPKGSGTTAIFASGIWLGGLVNGDAGQLRASAATYSNWEMWPGPLDDAGEPPADCAPYDRIWVITKDDITNFQETGTATQDMLDWPFDLGAPVVDGDGNPNNYNLQAGDLPELIGDQTAWWIMNDAGNNHNTTNTPPLRVEIQAEAFAFNQAGPLGVTTFYKFKMIYKGSQTLEDVYFGLWSDPDLGNASDDYVGSDSTLGVGYVYNGDNNDEGGGNYGNQPPALGYDFFQGPLVDDDGVDNNRDGTVDEPGERIGMQKFVYYNNDNTNQGNPNGGVEYYQYLRGEWRDGQPITFGGSGRGFSSIPTSFMFPADPPKFWSEDNIDGAGTRNQPADRRFLQSSGPFTMHPGDEQEIVFGIVFGQGSNRIGSVALMKQADIVAQGAFNLNFDVPPPPDPPQVSVDALDEALVLTWSNAATSNNFLNQYEQPSPFLVNDTAPDKTFNFEGYIVYQYKDESFRERAVVDVFDKANSVDIITGDGIDPNTGAVISEVLVPGTDQGIKQSIEITQDAFTGETLRNYTEYIFGVQAYAYNPFSSPPIYASAIARVTAMPAKPEVLDGGQTFQSDIGDQIASEKTTGIGDPFGIFATVASPADVTGDTYEVRVHEVTGTIDGVPDQTAVSYDIVDATTNTVIVDAQDFLNRNGAPPPFANDILAKDGLVFNVNNAPADYKEFLTVANQDGPIDPAVGGAADFAGFPVPSRPTADNTGMAGQWMIHTGDNGGRGSYSAFQNRTTNGDINTRVIAPYDFEIRFTDEGSLAYDPFCTGLVSQVPFELWRIGIDTPDDPSDDVRMVPYLLDNDFSSLTGVAPTFNLNSDVTIQAATDDPDIGGACGTSRADQTASSGDNDPQTDWIYWATPTDDSPGEAGYQAWAAAAEAGGDDFGYGTLATDNSIRRMVLFSWNGGDTATGDYVQDLPPTGAVFRITTTKPLQPGAVFTINSSEFAAQKDQGEQLAEALDRIAVVPNPYRGASEYEVTNISDVVRFTNMPQRATVRIFTVAGQHVRTLEKSGPAPFLQWDLTTEDGLPIASGMYLIHVDVPGVGQKVLKLGVVKKRIQLDRI